MQAAEVVDYSGQTVDRYTILALIRGGAQGRVYRGRDEVLRREVAIKVLNPNSTHPARSRHDLITEARALSSLNHPNVAGVYDFVTQQDRDFMVMEFIAGATLEEVLAGGPLPFPEVVRLGSQLARGLAAAHAAGIAHCDIKPANLKITSSGLLKIVDFGVATRLPAGVLLDEATTTTSVAAGTLPYMAPEVLHGELPDERSDIFSAGAVLYEMAAGCRAFPQRTLAGLVHALEQAEVVSPSRINPAVPIAIDRIILKALEKESACRHQTVMQLAEALEGTLAIAGRAPRTRSGIPATRDRVVWHLFGEPKSRCVPSADQIGDVS